MYKYIPHACIAVILLSLIPYHKDMAEVVFLIFLTYFMHFFTDGGREEC